MCTTSRVAPPSRSNGWKHSCAAHTPCMRRTHTMHAPHTSPRMRRTRARACAAHTPAQAPHTRPRMRRTRAHACAAHATAAAPGPMKAATHTKEKGRGRQNKGEKRSWASKQRTRWQPGLGHSPQPGRELPAALQPAQPLQYRSHDRHHHRPRLLIARPHGGLHRNQHARQRRLLARASAGAGAPARFRARCVDHRLVDTIDDEVAQRLRRAKLHAALLRAQLREQSVERGRQTRRTQACAQGVGARAGCGGARRVWGDLTATPMTPPPSP
eukprot:365427-Chlamydomonas_euryale.AAC.1